jgi:prepilin-type N-terminal cleavage/methylation domain-containing protein
MKKNSFGFTLIELLIAITIGMLVVGFGTVSLNNFFENQKVELTRQELMANLRFARNYAATNQFTDDGNRLSVTINNDGLMEMKSYKEDDITYVETIFSKDITPKNIGVTFLSSFLSGAIKFSVTDGRSIGGTASIIINGANTTKIIKIDESGLIYEE